MIIRILLAATIAALPAELMRVPQKTGTMPENDQTEG